MEPEGLLVFTRARYWSLSSANWRREDKRL